MGVIFFFCEFRVCGRSCDISTSSKVYWLGPTVFLLFFNRPKEESCFASWCLILSKIYWSLAPQMINLLMDFSNPKTLAKIPYLLL